MKDEEKNKELATLIVDEFIRRVHEELGKSILKKLFWIGIAGLLMLGVKLGYLRVQI